MKDSDTISSWDELLASLETAVSHPVDTAWQIYRYLQNNYTTMGSHQVRMLLVAYLKLPVDRPSLVHSCVLGIAVKISSEYADFQFPQFLQMWGYDRYLREEDKQRQTGKDGRSYPSLMQRVERRLQSYALHHQSEMPHPVDGIKDMVAVKVFEKQMNGKRRYFAKLVASDGMELVASSHLFPCKPWEIQGRMYSVSVRVSKEGNERADEIVVSEKNIADAFPPVVGYVDGVDMGHRHYHIYDSLSRHFVAEKPALIVKQQDFVVFSPVIPAVDKFKSAIISTVLPHDEGMKAFGTMKAEITYMNTDEGYLRYRITSPIADTPEGTLAEEGFARLSAVADDKMRQSLTVGDSVSLILFLKRGKDGEKRNHVVEIS